MRRRLNAPPAPVTLWPRGALALWLMASAAAAWAAPADYRCDNGQVLNATMTPRDALLKLEGQQWTLRRVRDRAEARFVNPQAGLTLTLVKSQAELARKDQPTLVCKLMVRALQPEALHGGPAPAPRPAP